MLVNVIVIYYCVMQLIGFSTMGIDKKRARQHAWRIPERRLWSFAIWGAGLGLWVGMRVFHHKTKHAGFRIGFPLFTLIHAMVLIWLFGNLK